MPDAPMQEGLLRKLWASHSDGGRALDAGRTATNDALLMVAAGLPGGWTTNQVRGLNTKPDAIIGG